ncbi:hypothetical protein RE474_04130 [Methanolobus sediminis]|uniref:Uncharacterized protein n=2 Tax=Methanolobus TaxID=2220 RepID=A0A1I4UC64_9EURY|nr:MULTISPECIES: hypothetical protein [Methanolobus]WMW25913.1 hypothetical protein RE474_04130 [Methanolobus sediminis]SFM86505.1 hypothetical protein SAMN04488696_2688 [Methanolobus profundi]
MGFTSGAKVLPDIVDEIADALIASSVNWVEGDATWDTTDRSTEATLARRCLKYTGDSADIWMTLEVHNYKTSEAIRYQGNDTGAQGLRVTFTSTWDSINHTWGDTKFQTFIGFEGRDWSYDMYTDMATLQINYWLWVDSTGFVVMGKPEPSSNDRQSSFICVMEHMGTKEYSDGLTNFYCYTTRNAWWAGTGEHSGLENYRMTRPFSFQDRDEDDGIQFYYDTPYARKSNGNGKVYFMKPVIHNTANNKTPIYQSELFFRLSIDAGLVDGDVIAIDGATTKFLCKMLTSPDHSNVLAFAMKYVA